MTDTLNIDQAGARQAAPVELLERAAVLLEGFAKSFEAEARRDKVAGFDLLARQRLDLAGEARKVAAQLHPQAVEQGPGH